jgi:hypothetical protein
MPSSTKVVRELPCLPGPAFLAISLKRWSALAFVLTSLVVVGGASFWGAAHHPDYTPPRGAQAQARIVDVFSTSETGDRYVVGDYAIERYYAMDLATGRFYVADLCKGRVRNVLESTRDDGTVAYTLDLDRSGLHTEELRRLRAQLPMPDDGSTYLGLQLQGGTREAFLLNYDGGLPRRRSDFRSAQGQDMRAFLRKIGAGAWRPAIHLLSTDGTNFVLTSTDVNTYFSATFGKKGLLLLSRLEFVDGSGRAPGPASAAKGE